MKECMFKFRTPIELDDTNINPITFTVPDDLSGIRIDRALAVIIPELSRSRLTNWLKDGRVLVNQLIIKPKDKVYGGEEVVITPELDIETQAFTPEDISLDIIYEDNHLIVINKPSGLTVHPGNGNWNGTLLNGLLFHYPELKFLPRAGIVHRLDKETSGLMVVAKTLLAQTNLVQQLQSRTVTRIYRAVVEGKPSQSGNINTNIGRDPHNRIKMAVLNYGGKPATTHYRVLKYFANFSYIECKLETGRTHQIRVHMKSINHPLVGDPVYGSKKINYDESIVDAIVSLNRQALHALKLQFIHPENNTELKFKVPLAQDIRYLLQQINNSELNNIETDVDDDFGDWEVLYVDE